jgi:hypothetical protein
MRSAEALRRKVRKVDALDELIREMPLSNSYKTLLRTEINFNAPLALKLVPSLKLLVRNAISGSVKAQSARS